jgi:segregation and condensation protein B
MLKSQIESVLFVSTKPLAIKDLTKLLKKGGVKTDKKEIQATIDELVSEYNVESRGIHIVNVDDKYQMVSSPDNKELVEKMMKLERTGDLTQPSLETLTIIAYRGPVSKVELEQIRGVNCSLILRNLMIRGLVEMSADQNNGQEMYNVTPEFMKYLGINTVDELPDYAKLHQIESLEEFLGKREKEQEK